MKRGDSRSIIIGLIGAALIAIPSAINGFRIAVGVGGIAGIALAALIIQVGYANRTNRAKSRSGIPAWGAGIGVFGAAVGIVAAEYRGGGTFVLAFLGGFLLALAVAQALLRRRLATR
ncbi:MAG TPA: hypothetical protein VJ986_10390 [Gaiellaceae bacterium]|nr:hypothetical protein [Gaiellaceae bacterium]